MKDFAKSDYQMAADYARHLARALNQDIALRGVVWYGKHRITVSGASRNDSDYARSEIVRPTDPCSATCWMCAEGE